MKGKTKTKDLVKLRAKPLKNGGSSLYLDYYEGGVRKTCSLSLYLNPGTDKATKEMNNATLTCAEAIRMQRQLDIQTGRAKILPSKQKLIKVADFYVDYIESLKVRESTKSIYYTTRALWLRFAGNNSMLQSVTPEMIVEFGQYIMKSGDTESTAHLHISRFKSMLHEAVRRNLIDSNPISRIKRGDLPSAGNAERSFLSIDEVRRLAETPCEDPVLKDAFLFCCFTGLRVSDARRLVPDMIHGDVITIRQKKTNRMVYIPLNDNSRRWLPEPDKEGYFFNIPPSHSRSEKIHEWASRAGIERHITFHTSRHTCATLLLTYGADIYTVSKILGHTNVNTTARYTAVMDKKKKDAMNNIPRI